MEIYSRLRYSQYIAFFQSWRPIAQLYDPMKHSQSYHRLDSISHNWSRLRAMNRIRNNSLNKKHYLCGYYQKFGQSWIFVCQISPHLHQNHLKPTYYHRSGIHQSRTCVLKMWISTQARIIKNISSKNKIIRLILSYKLKEVEK